MLELLWRQAITPIAHQAAESAKTSLRRLVLRAVVLLSATLAAAMGLAWLSWTAFAWLARDNDPVLAAAIVGLVLLSAALTAGLCALRSENPKPATDIRTAVPDSPVMPTNDHIADAIATAERILHGKAGSAAIIALVAGVSLGAFSATGPKTPQH
jgi:hypothetical protein